GGLFDQAFDRRGCLGTHAFPVAQAVMLNAQAFFAAPGGGVVKADTLDEPAIATDPLVGYHDTEKRTVLGAATGKSNDDHDLSLGGGLSRFRRWAHEVLTASRHATWPPGQRHAEK